MLELKANKNWPQNCGRELPKVTALVSASAEFVSVRFEVEEPEACYRATVERDGGPCYQDSCVEIFLEVEGGAYRNFEFNSLGHLLSAKGRSRENRVQLSTREYESVIRRAQVRREGGKIRWTLEAKLPRSFNFTGRGNLYKCADLASSPHYLALFKIETPKPDFHRPEFFGQLF